MGQGAEGARRIERNPPIGGFQREDAAEGRRDTDRTPAVRPQAQRTRAQRDRGRAAATGAARGPLGIVRIAGDPVDRAVGDTLPAELRGRRLSHEHRAVLAQPRHRGRVLVPRLALGPYGPRTAQRGRAAQQQDVLHRHRNPVHQARGGPAPPPLGGLLRLPQRALGVHPAEGVHLRLYLLDPVEDGTGRLDRGELAGGIELDELNGCQVVNVRHPALRSGPAISPPVRTRGVCRRR